MKLPIRTTSELGQLIRSMRESRGLTQQDVANGLGVSRKWVNEVESGKPRAELYRVLDVIGYLGGEVRVTTEDSRAEKS